jgi:hypothetical protein
VRGRCSGLVEPAGSDVGAGMNLANRWIRTSGPMRTNALNASAWFRVSKARPLLTKRNRKLHRHPGTRKLGSECLSWNEGRGSLLHQPRGVTNIVLGEKIRTKLHIIVQIE